MVKCFLFTPDTYKCNCNAVCRVLSLHGCAYGIAFACVPHTAFFLFVHTHSRPCVDICQTDLVDGFCLLHITGHFVEGMEQFYILTVSYVLLGSCITYAKLKVFTYMK